MAFPLVFTLALALTLVVAPAGPTAAAAEADGEGGECDAGDRPPGVLRPSTETDPDAVAGDDASLGRMARRVACEDRGPECEGWASRGECENNPGYMLSEFDRASSAARRPSPFRSGSLRSRPTLTGRYFSLRRYFFLGTTPKVPVPFLATAVKRLPCSSRGRKKNCWMPWRNMANLRKWR